MASDWQRPAPFFPWLQRSQMPPARKASGQCRLSHGFSCHGPHSGLASPLRRRRLTVIVFGSRLRNHLRSDTAPQSCHQFRNDNVITAITVRDACNYRALFVL